MGSRWWSVWRGGGVVDDAKGELGEKGEEGWAGGGLWWWGRVGSL